MRVRARSFLIVASAVMLAMAALVPFASPAGALTDNCSSPGGISEFPDAPAAQSSLSVACVLTTATSSASGFYNTEDFGQAQWHFGAGKRVSGTTTSGSKVIKLTAGHFDCTPSCAKSHDINHGISGYAASKPLDLTVAGSNIPAGAIIVTVTSTIQATLNKAATATTPSGTSKAWTIENADSRTVTDGHLTSATTTVTSATAHFCTPALVGCGATNNDVGRTITGTDIPHGTTIAGVTNTTTMTLSQPANATSTTEQLTIGPAANLTTARFVHDAHTAASSKTVTSASAAFQTWDTGMPVSGTNIPAGDTIAAVVNATTITLATAATAATSAGSLTIGGPNATAPANGDTALSLGAELDLNPALVKGSDPCTAATPEGFVITGGWQNPGSYIPSSLFGSQTDVSLKYPTIGQFAVPTAVVTFAGYVMQVPAGSTDTNTAAHYDVVFPHLPTSLAVCSANTAGVASTFEFLGTTHAQSGIPTGVGTPSDAQTRALKDLTTSSVSDTATLHIRATSASSTDTFTFTGNCTENYPDTVDFGCGIG